jgi:hypothetical protein
MVFSALSLIGLFLPIASNGDMYIAIYQLKDTSSLLYIISPALVVLSAVNLFRKIEDAKILLIASSLFGLTILIYSTAEAINIINRTVQESIELENIQSRILKDFRESRKEIEEMQKEVENLSGTITQASPANVGLGAYLMALGFLGVLGFSCLPENQQKMSKTAYENA